MNKAIPHTDNNLSNSITTIIITHPFHPDKGKEYEYLGQTTEHVRCMDNKGNIRLFPIKNTNLYITAIDKCSYDENFVAPIDDLLALKELTDRLQSRFGK